MVCTANDLQRWKDFPKGLRVLLLDWDTSSASNIRSKLEAMDYVVSTFYNETEALSAFSSKPESYHVAIVEVNTRNGEESFRFLTSAKDLPIIMTSDVHCLTTIMKCIALGAVEFLRKPISEDKLRNIWQHVVHKAFNSGGSVLSEPLKPAKESSVSMLPLELENGGNSTVSNESKDQENDQEHSAGCDKYPAPSTPQINHGARLFDDKDCQDQTNCSTEKECGEGIGECKSVETTCGNSVAESTPLVEAPQKDIVAEVKEEEDSVDGSRSESNTSSNPHNGDSLNNAGGGTAENPSKMPVLNNSCKSKSNRKKIKVDWTSELHKKFVQAVEQLGVDQAIPSRILELMKVEGLTRHNVASHLQKYRMHKRSILPKEEDRRWQRSRDAMHRNYYHTKPVMAYPPYHSNHALSIATIYPMWGQPGNHPATNQIWSPPGCTPLQPTESWQWKPYTGMHADAWGCPVVPPSHGLYNNSYVQNASGFHNAGVVVNNGGSMNINSFDSHPADELIDKVVKEAISKPWLPLPLGLKPPSTDGVLSELSRQGISSIPYHHINDSHNI